MKMPLRQSALVRLQGVIHWMNKMKPLGLEPTVNMYRTSMKMHRQNGGVGSGEGGGEDEVKNNSTLLLSGSRSLLHVTTDTTMTQDSSNLVLTHHSTTATASLPQPTTTAPVVPAKRKYVFKNRALPSSAQAMVAAAEVAAAEAKGRAEEAAQAALPAATSALLMQPGSRILRGLTTLPSASASPLATSLEDTVNAVFVLETPGAATHFAAGEGVVHTREVELDAPVFQLEAKKCADRKAILKQQMSALKNKISEVLVKSNLFIFLSFLNHC